MTWTVVGGNVANHLSDAKDEAGTRGKFKQPRDQGPRKLIEISNELVVYNLARLSGLATTYSSFVYIEERPGILSIVESELNWSYIANNHLQASVLNLDQFRQLLPFDLWIANTDRSSGRMDHVIVRQAGNSYLAYPIDASHTLNGCSGELWNLSNVEDTSRLPIEGYSHVSENEIQNYTQLEPMIFRIQMLSDITIASVVDTVTTQVSFNRPNEEVEALRGNSEVVKKILSFRRNPLALWVKKWCQAKGKETPVESTGVQVSVG